MRRLTVLAILVFTATLVAARPAIGQSADLVRDVRAAIAAGDLAGADRLVTEARAAQGNTPETLAALSWLGRGALAAGDHEQAAQYAAETYELAREAVKTTPIEDDSNLEAALGAAIEVEALARAARGERSAAVYFLQRELDTYGDTPLHKRIQKNLNVLSLEGQPAPALVAGETLGRPLPAPEELKGKPVLLFFWAHWCPDCKAQGTILEKLLRKYESQGLEIVAPTQVFGYISRREGPAAREKELEQVVKVRNEHYGFLRDKAAPISEKNHLRYGVSTTPTLALVDRDGIVRLYHPGNMTEEALEEAIRKVL